MATNTGRVASGSPRSSCSSRSSRSNSCCSSSSSHVSHGSLAYIDKDQGPDRASKGDPPPPYSSSWSREPTGTTTKPPPTTTGSRAKQNGETQNREVLPPARSVSQESLNERLGGRDRGLLQQQQQQQQPHSSKHVVIDVMPMDENNVPQIDQVITPPASPSTRPNMINTTSLKGLRHKLPSLKFKGGRFGSFRSSQRNKDQSNNADSANNPLNPTITVTMNDDADSMISDYLSPEKNYKRGVYIGDDVSLYGTPKEELSPLREQEPKSTPAHVSATNYLKDQIISFFQPSDNKLAMKLFGNKNALMKEKRRQKEAGNWVIHPCSNFR